MNIAAAAWTRSTRSSLWIVLALVSAAYGCDSDDDKSVSQGADVDAAIDAGAEGVDPTTLIVPTIAALRGVWGSSTDDIWFVGELGTVMHFDGQALTLLETGIPSTLMSVHGSGPDDVWFVGDQGATAHWDGTRITVYPPPRDYTFSLLSVWSSGVDDAWSVGIMPTPTDRVGLVRHWDGESWEMLQVPDAVSLWEIWGSGSDSDEVWMVGTDQALGGYIVRATGPILEPIAFSGGPLRGVWGAADDDIWVVPYDSPAQHWDGSEWSATDVMPDQAMLATGGNTTKDVWSVGLGGTILHFDGDSWTPHESPTAENLWSVWGSGKRSAWAAGGAGTLLYYDGETWTRLQNSPGLQPIPTL